MKTYTPLTEPFEITFEKDGTRYRATAVYAKATDTCANVFTVNITEPAGMEPILLKDKPILTPEFEYMVWVDQDDRPRALYQQIGTEIERHLKEKMGVFLMDVSTSHEEQEKK